MFDPGTIIALLALVAVVFWAVRYLVRSRRRGVKCVGCPFASACGGKVLVQLQPCGPRKGDSDASYRE